MTKKFLTILSLLLSFTIGANAQEYNDNPRRIQYPPMPFFVPHWFITAQGGAAYDVGEGKFKELISPAAQLSVGYQFTPLIGTRLAVSGWESRNRYTSPKIKYKWNFVQPAVDLMLNLNTLFFGWQETPVVDTYAFIGAGVSYSFNNDDAEIANRRDDVEFQKLWHDYRFNPVLRGGLGADVRITDHVAIGAEVNANMLPDHYNSKNGRESK